jgi:hypothetical protein
MVVCGLSRSEVEDVMTGDSFYQLFQQAKKVLRRDPSLADEAVAERCGFSPRMLVADNRIEDTIREARRDLRNAGEIPGTSEGKG